MEYTDAWRTHWKVRASQNLWHSTAECTTHQCPAFVVALKYYTLMQVVSAGLLHRASMEGPLWCEVLKQFISVLESSVDEEDRLTVLPDFIRSALPILGLAPVSPATRQYIAQRFDHCTWRQLSFHHNCFQSVTLNQCCASITFWLYIPALSQLYFHHMPNDHTATCSRREARRFPPLYFCGAGCTRVCAVVFSVVLRDMEPGLVLAAISGLSSEGKREVEGRLMACIRGRESG